MNRQTIFRYSWRAFLSGLVIGALIIAALGVRLLGGGASAATYSHNPFGYADSCALEGSSTVLYGWAHDPDAPAGSYPTLSIKVGSSTTTVPTDRAGYRDSVINQYINGNYPGMPTSSVYGWRLSLTGLYKGSKYIVSGTINNYGTGANGTLAINASHNIDGNTAKPYFNSDRSIPDACLSTAPLPAPSPPPTGGGGTTTPTPTPSKPPASKPATGSTATPTPAGPTLSDAADSTITAGTGAVKMEFPVGNASSLYVVYGTQPANLSFTSNGAVIDGDQASVTLTGLDAQTTYTYQIVRTLNGQSTTSTASTFVTAGYQLTIHFTNAKKQPVSGIKVSLGSAKTTSDKKGAASFDSLSSGVYHPEFTYQDKSYTTALDTAKAPAVSGTKIATVSTTINLDGLATNTAVKPAGGSHVWLVIILLLLLAVITFVAVRLIRRRAGYTPQVRVSTDLPKNHVDHHFMRAAAPSEPPPEHMGESLAQMVIESMHAENARRKAQEPPKKDD